MYMGSTDVILIPMPVSMVMEMMQLLVPGAVFMLEYTPVEVKIGCMRVTI